jgi:small subunit ribosomal protein S20
MIKISNILFNFAVHIVKLKIKQVMANHASAKKRIRQNETRRVHNKYYAKSSRTAIKNLRSTDSKQEATEMLPKVSSMLDKLVKRNIIHKNKAANLKSSLTKHVNKLS